jgi:hypothetical protein
MRIAQVATLATPVRRAGSGSVEGLALRPAATIHHDAHSSPCTLRMEPEDYVCFLGRFTWGNGPLAAIAAARALGSPQISRHREMNRPDPCAS